MRLEIETEERTEGRGKSQRTLEDLVLVGDRDFFFWLQNAAGSAGGGVAGQWVTLPDGRRLELRPENPVEQTTTRGGRAGLRLQANADGS